MYSFEKTASSRISPNHNFNRTRGPPIMVGVVHVFFYGLTLVVKPLCSGNRRLFLLARHQPRKPTPQFPRKEIRMFLFLIPGNSGNKPVGGFSPVKSSQKNDGVIYCRYYRHYRTGKLMDAWEYGYQSWRFLRKSK